MRTEAMEKINGEMQEHPDDRVLEAVGQYLIDHMTEEDAGRLTKRGKSLSGAVKAMEDAARRTAKNGVGVLTDAEAWRIVRAYYGLPEEEAAQERENAPKRENGIERETAIEREAALELDFDALWG